MENTDPEDLSFEIQDPVYIPPQNLFDFNGPFLNQHETVARSRPSDSNSSGSSVSQSNISSSLNSSSSLPPPMAIFRSLPRPNKSKMTTSDEVKINAKTSLEV